VELKAGPDLRFVLRSSLPRVFGLKGDAQIRVESVVDIDLRKELEGLRARREGQRSNENCKYQPTSSHQSP
jgi:hypothetical protein